MSDLVTTGQVLLTTDSILTAPSDIVEDILEVPEWGGCIKIRSLTASEQAKVKQASWDFRSEATTLIFAEMEKRQFEFGVVEPKFTADQVAALFERSGPSWQRVINALDALSNSSREKLKDAAEAFRGGGSDSPADSGTAD